MKPLLLLSLVAAAGAGIYFTANSSDLSTEEKRAALVGLTKNEANPQAGKPFLKMSPEEVDTCYKFMFYYRDVQNAGKNKREMPADFKTKIAAVSTKWNIFT